MDKHYNYADNPQQWVDVVARLRGPESAALLNTAINFYPPGSPHLGKGLAIADILFSLGLDTLTLAAVIAYPAYKEHDVHIDTIADNFGENTRMLLHDVNQMQSFGKLQQLSHPKPHQVENLRKMLLAMVSDVRAVLIVLAERLWQLRNAKLLTPISQHDLAQETYNVYAPLANRLGVWQLKWEIEDLCLRYLQPDVYITIARNLASRRVEREAYITNMINEVTGILTQAQIPKFEISGRVKHIYSIYKKMQRKNADFERIYDISALRVLVPAVNDCYNVLSVIQDAWQQVHEEFDDYISNPKPNGYRSIHTVVLGPQNHYVEIQIRTHEMHQESELGVAAHWRYKEGVLQASNYEAKIALLRQVMAWQREIAQSQTSQEPEDLFADRVYVFTPTGDIMDLPQGATPLDFAYYVHSEVGHRCRGAKIDGNIVPLTYTLQTGQRVEILTAKVANPSRDWLNPHLNYLKTSRARSKAQHWFRLHDGSRNLSDARDIVEKEVKRLGLQDKFDMNALAVKLHSKNNEDFLTAVSTGEIKISQITHALLPLTLPQHTPEIAKPEKSLTPNIEILGINNLLTHIAKCCKPLPGDKVIGYITQNRGISIHRYNCPNIHKVTDEQTGRLMDVGWDEKHATTYPVDLLVRAKDHPNLIRDITALFANEKIRVAGLQAYPNNKEHEIEVYLTIEIPDVARLNKSLHHLKEINGMIDVRRR